MRLLASNIRQFALKTFELDETDWSLLSEVQSNARTSTAEIGRRVGLTAPATAERLRRLEENGVIRGYHAAIDVEKIGRPIFAFIRLRFNRGRYDAFERLVKKSTAILECHHITGEDCFIVKAAVASMAELERLAAALSHFGPPATSVVYSTAITRRNILPPAD